MLVFYQRGNLSQPSVAKQGYSTPPSSDFGGLTAPDRVSLTSDGLLNSRHTLSVLLAGLLIKSSLALGATSTLADIHPSESGSLDLHSVMLTGPEAAQDAADHGIQPLQSAQDMEWVWNYLTERGLIVYMPVTFNYPGHPWVYTELGIEQAANPSIDMVDPFYVVKDLSLPPQLTQAQRDELILLGVTLIEFPVGGNAAVFADWLLHYMCPDCSDSVDVSPAHQPEQPRYFDFVRNYPNPFNPATTISFSLTQPADVALEISNLLGQKLWEWDGQGLGSGEHAVFYDASGSASGPQYARFTISPLTPVDGCLTNTAVLPLLNVK